MRKIHKHFKITRRGTKYFGIGTGPEAGIQFGAQAGPRAANNPTELRRRIDADPDTNK